MSLRTATEQLRVARALVELPKITEAFAAGRISYSKVRAITRITGSGAAPVAAPDEASGGAADDVATDETATGDAATDETTADGPATDDTVADETVADETVADETAIDGAVFTDPAAGDTEAAGVRQGLAADAEQTLLNLALAGTASHVEHVVRATRRRQADPTRSAAQRCLSWHWAEDGSLVLRGRLTPADGAALVAAVEALVPARTPVAHPVPAQPPDWQRQATEQSPGAVADIVGARRVDALVALVTGVGTGASSAGQADPAAPVVTRGQTQVVVHIEAGTGSATIAGGPEIPAATAERLACDSVAQVLLEDKQCNRLYLGRSRRLASPAQIAALTVRDGGRCQFPGCTHTRHLHAHHVQSWFRGGRTDIDNLILLCSHHHTVIHDHGYRIRRIDGAWQVRRPDGTTVTAAGAPLTGDVGGLLEIHTRAALRITRESLTPTWAGERLDPEPILDSLLPRPRVAAA